MRKSKLSGKKQYFFIALYIADISSFIASYALAFFLIFDFRLETIAIILPSTRLLLFVLLLLIINYSSFKLYRDKRSLFDGNEFMNLAYANAMTYMIVIIFTLLFDFFNVLIFAILSMAFIASFVLTTISRYLLSQTVSFFRKKGYDKKNVMFFGNNNDLESRIKEDGVLGYNLLGHTESLEELEKSIDNVDIVFISRDRVDEDMIDFIIRNDKVNWKIIPSVLNLVLEPVRFDEFKDYPIINISPFQTDSLSLAIKRIGDIVASGLALVVLSPLFLFIAIMIKVTMPGPVFFKQKRLGKDLKEFWFYKFRSMVVDAEAQKKKLMKKNEVKGLFKMKEDPRITKFGKFLRRTCLDELAQLINIFRGDMSIVGPRPHLKSELDHFQGWRQERFKIKPGLTGLWQVNGRHELNLDKAILYDIYYIKHMSLLLDISIILKTIPAIIMSKGRF